MLIPRTFLHKYMGFLPFSNPLVLTVFSVSFESVFYVLPFIVVMSPSVYKFHKNRDHFCVTSFKFNRY